MLENRFEKIIRASKIKFKVSKIPLDILGRCSNNIIFLTSIALCRLGCQQFYDMKITIESQENNIRARCSNVERCSYVILMALICLSVYADWEARHEIATDFAIGVKGAFTLFWTNMYSIPMPMSSPAEKQFILKIWMSKVN